MGSGKVRLVSGSATSVFIIDLFDWAFANLPWFTNWSNSCCDVTPGCISDHEALIVRHNGTNSCRRVAFRFFNVWFKHPTYDDIVKRVWARKHYGNHMYILYQKVKDLSKERGLNREAYMDITSRVNTARVKLEQVQTTLQQDPFNTILQNEERDLYSQLKTLSSNEEEVLRQKSRVQWIQV